VPSAGEGGEHDGNVTPRIEQADGMVKVDFDAAVDFIWRNARLVESRLFACRFLGASNEGVVAAVRGYQNDDGGFGHGLESDLRGPTSQPIHVDTAFRILHEAGADAPEMVAKACAYLASVGTDRGGVPAIFPSAAEYPRASHWDPDFWSAESVNPTAMIVGMLYVMRVGNVWLDRATPFCWDLLTDGTVEDGPALAAAFSFLNHTPDRRRAERVADGIAAQIPKATFFSLQPGEKPGYALTPLDLAPRPDCMARVYFTDDLMEAHLDELASRQQPDGGWPLAWEPPGPGAALEWRGRVTVDALLTMQAWGRL
jgi:hypothetical protein